MHNCPCLRRALRRRNLRLRRVPMSSPGPSMATSTCKKNEIMQLKFKVPDEVTWKKEAAACDKHSGKDESITIRNGYPKPPVPYFEVTEGFNMQKILEFMSERSVSIAKSIANDIIILDPAHEKIFLDTTDCLQKKQIISLKSFGITLRMENLSSLQFYYWLLRLDLWALFLQDKWQ